MMAYLPIIEQLIKIGLSRKNPISAVKFNMAGLAFMVCGLCTIFASIIFIIIAFQDWLRLMLDSPYANSEAWALCALLTLAASALFMSLAHKFKKSHNGLVSLSLDRQPSEPFMKGVSDEVVHQVKEYPLVSVLVAGLAGMMAGEKIGDKVH